MTITAEDFRKMTGHAPVQDDLERCNCRREGVGHWYCGVCHDHNQPRFECGCRKEQQA